MSETADQALAYQVMECLEVPVRELSAFAATRYIESWSTAGEMLERCDENDLRSIVSIKSIRVFKTPRAINETFGAVLKGRPIAVLSAA